MWGARDLLSLSTSSCMGKIPAMMISPGAEAFGTLVLFSVACPISRVKRKSVMCQERHTQFFCAFVGKGKEWDVVEAEPCTLFCSSQRK